MGRASLGTAEVEEEEEGNDNKVGMLQKERKKKKTRTMLRELDRVDCSIRD